MYGIEQLVGKTLVKIERGDYDGNEALIFYADDNTVYRMYHDQDCCESVWIEDINGDLDDLLNTPITSASERTEDGSEDSMWTFYHVETNKGSVVIRWNGQSEYYSVSVSFQKA